MDKQEVIKVLDMIAEDQANDAREFEGQPFNGKTVAEYFGNQGAAIAALANIVKSLIIDIGEERYKKAVFDIAQRSGDKKWG